ncbi:hypothetical protein EAF04_003883 [Stromatinia cepivora]|nr:hypothetical protein EAF04_003883 [Stromatinia cepivora]
MSQVTTKSVVKAVLLGIVTLPCLCLYAPCVFICYQAGKSRPRHRTHEHRDRYCAGYPIPSKLRSNDSALTLPLSPAPYLQHRKHTTYSQDQCLLLTKLPVELRKSIWELCLGGRRLHFTIAHYRGEKQSRLVHIVCHEKPNHQGCFSHWLPLELPFNDDGNMIAAHPWQNSKFLSLVLTCRRIYSEAIDCLYANNTFDLSVYCIRILPSLLLPQRLNAIRSLHLKWETVDGPPAPPSSKGFWEPFWGDWVNTWKILAGIKSLSALHVELTGNVFFNTDQWMGYRRDEKVLILQPVRDVAGPATFHVLFPFNLPPDDPSLKALPCSISFTTQYP